MIADILVNFRAALACCQHSQMQDALSHGQIQSKQWLIEALSSIKHDLGNVYVLCNWYGVLPMMLFESGFFDIKKCVGFDIDPLCEEVADSFNRHLVKDNWTYKSATTDITKLDYTVSHYDTHRRDGSIAPQVMAPDTLICCGCEHVKKGWFNRIPPGKLVILQGTNDTVSAGHINIDEHLASFVDTYPLPQTLFTGEITLESQFKRFMVIGIT